MNKYSLTFHNKETEFAYLSSIFMSYYPIFRRNLYLLSITFVIALVYNFIHENIWLGVTALILLLLMFILLQLMEKFQVLFDWICFLFQSFFVILYTLKPIQNILEEEFGTFQGGFLVAYIIQRQLLIKLLSTESFDLGSRFSLKGIIVLLNLLILIITNVVEEKLFSMNNYAIMIGSLMALNQLYIVDKNKREGFQAKLNEQIWQKNLDDSIGLSIIQCTYQEQNHKFKMVSNNQTSIQMVHITDNSQFIQFLRRSYLQVNRKIYNKLVTLEKLLFYKYYSKDSDKELKQLAQGSEFIIINEDNTFKVKIFTYQADISIIAILLMKDDEIKELQRLKERLKLINKVQEDEKQIINQRLVECIGITNFILRDMKTQIKRQKLLLQAIKLKMFQVLGAQYNSQIFFNPLLQITAQKFKLQTLIKHIFGLINVQLVQHQIKSEVYYDKKIEIFSSYKNIFQILFNIIQQLIPKNTFQNNANNQFLTLTIIGKEVQIIQNVKQRYLSFIFKTNLSSLQQIKMSNIKYLNPLQIEKLQAVNKSPQTQLNLIVSQHIVGQMGPSDKINYQQYDNWLKISFNIYTCLEQNLISTNKNLKILQFESKESVFEENDYSLQYNI